MAKKKDKVKELINNLNGTCKSMCEGIQEVYGEDEDTFSVDIGVLTVVDEEIFRCETCSWWYEVRENGGDNICKDCSDE